MDGGDTGVVVVVWNCPLEDLLEILGVAVHGVGNINRQVRSDILHLIVLEKVDQPWVSAPSPKVIGSAPRPMVVARWEFRHLGRSPRFGLPAACTIELSWLL